MIKELEALKIGPDDLLVLRVPAHWDQQMIDDMGAVIRESPFEGRVLVITDDIEVAGVVKA